MQAIRCHAYAPVAPDELEGWLARDVDEIRAAAPNATVRFMRLSQAGSAGHVAVGWLIELEGIHGEVALTDLQLDAVLRDMRLLGLQPTFLGSSDAGSRDSNRHRSHMRTDAALVVCGGDSNAPGSGHSPRPRGGVICRGSAHGHRSDSQ